MMTLPLDHLSILSKDESASRAWYGLLLPMLGFVQAKAHIWRNDSGLHLQFGAAKPDTRAYQRYGAGLNHLGFAAPSVAFVEDVAAQMAGAGHEARLQRFADGTVALFLPDPDGLRVEISFYPAGTPPVD